MAQPTGDCRIFVPQSIYKGRTANEYQTRVITQMSQPVLVFSVTQKYSCTIPLTQNLLTHTPDSSAMEKIITKTRSSTLCNFSYAN
jgi:hypothetical protein